MLHLVLIDPQADVALASNRPPCTGSLHLRPARRFPARRGRCTLFALARRDLRRMKIDIEQAIAFRLRRQHLDRRLPRVRLKTAVRDLVGVQAQVPSAAAIGLWSRVAGIAARDVERAVEARRSVARTWCMRGTIHLVDPADLPMISAALGAKVGGLLGSLQRMGLTERRYQEIRSSILELMDEPRSRAEVEAAIDTSGPWGKTLIGSWGGILAILSREGSLVFGPRRGAETTFVRRDVAYPRLGEVPPREDAVASLLARYLAAYGPATDMDFAYWSGLIGAEGRQARSRLGDAVSDVWVDGKIHHLLARDVRALKAAQPPAEPVRLLPNFDVYLLSHRDRSDVVEPRRAKDVFRAGGWVTPTVLVGGRVAGTWAVEKGRGGRIVVKARPWGRLEPTAKDALRREVESLEAFLGSNHRAR